MTCPSLETVAAWLLGELSDEEGAAFEEHYFGCEACFDRAERMQKLVLKLESALPPILTADRLVALETRRGSLPTVHVQPGDSGTVRLGGENSMAVWVLHCELTGVTRVDFEARRETGEPFFDFQDVPFDVERGQVLLPCHLHYYRARSAEPRFFVRLSARDSSGSRPLGEYLLNHEFENA
jgi:putative zinc finger protein